MAAESAISLPHQHMHTAEAAAHDLAIKPSTATSKSSAPKSSAPAPKPTAISTSATLPTSSTITLTTTATTTTAQIASTTDTNTVASQLSGSTDIASNKSHVGLIAGVAAGVIILLVLIAGILFRAKRRRGREARDAELYQQRTMMNKYSDGSAFNGYSHENSSQAESQQNILLSRQPEWFSKKSPLEYYKQVPPLAELKQLKQQQLEEQQQQQESGKQQIRPLSLKHGASDASTSTYYSSSYSVSSSATFAQKGAAMAAKILTPDSTDSTANGQDIALNNTYTYQKNKFQHPRIMTQGLHQSSSLYSGSATKSPSSLSSTIGYIPSYQDTPSPPTQLPANSLHVYTPPPPTSAPFSPVSSHSIPSTGFYDMLDVDEDQRSITTTKTFNLQDDDSPLSPPPVPRATRPISVASASSFKIMSTNAQSEDSIPAVPALPQVPSQTISP
ncbi:hypothetical protein BGZ49_006959 [Haplosporangium sp. Z 27]|nr:hypothetical protein BGZ49_006959 [Haplosporangium sp. Z 27]